MSATTQMTIAFLVGMVLYVPIALFSAGVLGIPLTSEPRDVGFFTAIFWLASIVDGQAKR